MEVPYLASKVLLLYNQTPDRATIVHYKRIHTVDKENKVYYGKFDFKTKQTIFVDITDSTTYNMFVEARSDKSVKESQNIGFILMVNKNVHQLLILDRILMPPLNSPQRPYLILNIFIQLGLQALTVKT